MSVQKAVAPPTPTQPLAAKIAVAGKRTATAKLDQFGFREGKTYALDAIESMTALLAKPERRQEIIYSLKRAATGRPASQALGIWHVIELVESQP